MNPFTVKGVWLKACLHCHTTESDGALSPKGVVSYYKKHGYKVVALTDHNKITYVEDDDVITFPGVEIGVGKGLAGHSFHVVAINIKEYEKPEVKDYSKLEEFLKELTSAGALILIAHPAWSSLLSKDLLAIESYHGIEVYNTGCDTEVGKGFSTVHWDQILAMRKLKWGYAVDDAHRYYYPPADSNRGWVMVKAEEDREHVLKALKEGSFYSSMGPEVKYYERKNNGYVIEMSPVVRVNFIADNGSGFSLTVSLIQWILKLIKEGSNVPPVEDVEEWEENGKKYYRVKLSKNRGITVRLTRSL
ncbi:MAG TPA: PHP domain-containing protein, partial [Thermoproteales archaeon]|nr:PHP domain-containing protein [Thermoproteales archaeon]